MICPAGKGLSMLIACLIAAFGMVNPVGDSQAATATAFSEKATRQLFQAIYANDLPSAQASVGDGADVEARDRWGMTPADLAIDRGHYRIAHFLVSVRNSRREHDAPPEPAAAPPPPAKAAAPAATNGKRPTIAPAATPVPAVAATPPAGPNPFDPSTPAPGSQLRTAAPATR
jgi:hypothetical protein